MEDNVGACTAVGTTRLEPRGTTPALFVATLRLNAQLLDELGKVHGFPVDGAREAVGSSAMRSGISLRLVRDGTSTLTVAALTHAGGYVQHPGS